MLWTRRSLLWSGAALAAFAAPNDRYRIGITTNTRGGWENDVWLSFQQAHQAGYRNVESFIHYFVDLFDRPEELTRRVQEIGVRFVTISNGGPLEMHFEDPAKHEKIVADHLRLARLVKKMGCSHLKINLGPRRPEGTTPEDLKQIARVLDALGKTIAAEGIKLAPHAHMWSQFENQREIEYVMGHTSSDRVYFVLDTGHITMAGMDPVKLARELGHRILEFHLKDVDPANRGGARERLAKHEPMTNPVFFPLGRGGVDFPALKAHLDSTAWSGWCTVELDSSPKLPPIDSARISRKYLEDTLRLKTG